MLARDGSTLEKENHEEREAQQGPFSTANMVELALTLPGYSSEYVHVHGIDVVVCSPFGCGQV